MRVTKAQRRVLVLAAAGALAAMVGYNLLDHTIHDVRIMPVNAWFILPFCTLLLAIAVMPFINRGWWEKNYPAVSYTLGFVVVFYYAFSLGNIPRLLLSSYEYVSFISLIGSLFVVSGGIHVRMKGRATPVGNVALLGSGAVLANILGTTGASMILIRPFIRMNRSRIRPYHVVFFIFLVSNIGGALTPIGDPPLFLGYLKGIPFFWIIERVAQIWILAVVLLLVVFYVWDRFEYDRHHRSGRHVHDELDEPEVSGLHNVVFLFVIIAAVFIDKPAPLMLRETVMWGAAIASFLTTKHEIHEKNEFNFHPIQEVAILFLGIFATMIPALDWLELNARSLGIVTPGQYFWGTGALSSFLDNAPTYLNFLSAAFGLHGASVDNVAHVTAMLNTKSPAMLGLSNPLSAGAQMITENTWRYVQAVSVGAVFFGAMTYIGNGPNFMVKSIAEQSKVHCPSFFGYMFRYSIPVLIPVFIVVWLIFFSF